MDDNRVMWIKAIRSELDCGLKEAKDLCDHVRTVVGGFPNPRQVHSVVVDTDRITFLKFLEQLAVSKTGRGIATVQAPVVQDADALLKRTAIKLINMNEFGKAIDVLKIVI